MISFSKLGNYGRLGNQLFQLAFITSFAKKYDLSYQIPKWEYAEYFDFPFNYSGSLPKTFDAILYEPGLCYNEGYFARFVELMRYSNVDIEGYLQSCKYFSKAHALSIFKPNSKFEPGFTPDHHCIAISVRRGDFVNHPDYNNIEAHTFMQVLSAYSNHQVFVFSDDFDYCREHFKGSQYEFMEGMTGIEQLISMSKFSKFILSNSTFSYWGPMLSPSVQSVHVPYFMFPNIYRCKLYNREYWPDEPGTYHFFKNPIDKLRLIR